MKSKTNFIVDKRIKKIRNNISSRFQLTASNTIKQTWALHKICNV